MSDGASATEAVQAWFAKGSYRERPKGFARAVRAHLATEREDARERLARERARAALDARDLADLSARLRYKQPIRDAHSWRCVCAECKANRAAPALGRDAV